MALYYFFLFILGTIFGSFSTVLIQRWKHGISGIMTGRSACPTCHHTLHFRELIPILSYIFQHGKCHNCHAKIGYFYPLTELFFGVIFLLVGASITHLWFDPISYTVLICLFMTFVTWVYMIYDIKYMEIPDNILIPWIFIIFILFILTYFFEGFWFMIFDYVTYQWKDDFILDHLLGAWYIYTFFYLQILIPWGIHLVRVRRFRDFFELLMGYIIFPIGIFLEYIFRKNVPVSHQEEDIPTWIGWGDLRIALFIGLTLGTIHTFSTLLFAYIIGSVIWVLILMRKWGSHQIPFWPFLGIGWILSIIFYSEILSIIENYWYI